MLRRVARLVPPCCSLLAGGVVAAWLFSRVATDRWILSQAMFWVPTPLYLAPAVLLALLGAVPLRRRRSSRVAAAALLSVVAAIAWLFIFEWRLPRALAMPEPPASGRGLRIIHWNLSSVDRSFRPEVLSELAGPEGADVFLLGLYIDGQRLAEAVARLGAGYSVVRIGGFAVVSRVAVLDVAADSLSLPAPRDLAREALAEVPSPASGGLHRLAWVQRFYNRALRSLGAHRRDLVVGDPGTLVRIRLDTTASLGRPIDLWWIDLPSSPLAPRYALARIAADRIRLLRAGANAADPDLFLGDFNIPRGSASLALIVAAAGAAMTHAFDQAAFGPVGSWPARRPLWLIDNAFTGPALRVARYRLVDAGASEHRAQDLLVDAATPAGP